MKVKYFNFFKRRNLPVVDMENFKSLESFYKFWKDKISDKDKEIIKIFLDFGKYTKFKKIIMVKKYKFTLYGSVEKLIFKIIFRPYFSKDVICINR